MNMNCKLSFAKIFVMVVAGVAALGGVVMLLWNWLIPTLFVGGKEIDYMQAMGVLLLSKILFSGFKGHGGHGRWLHHRWEQMTPEEREKFQSGMRGCCGKHKKESAEGLENPHE